jgi:predicted nucleic acid-binding Zn ribbon protein
MIEQPERYCSNCGHELRPEDQFCSNCGMPVHRAARVPTPEADRPVPPLPPPTQEVGRSRRSLPGSGALRGRGRKVVVLLVLGVLILYLVLPLVMESLISGSLAIETESCSLSVEAPPILIDQNQACLNYLGLGAGY